MKLDQDLNYQEKRVGVRRKCKCTKSSIPSSAKVAESLAFEAVAEDYKGNYKRALELYNECLLSVEHCMKNDLKCDVLTNELRSMNDMYKKRVERLILHLEKRKMRRRIAEEKKKN